MRWWPLRRRNGKAEARERLEAAERELRAAQQMTRHVRQVAPAIAATLTDAEFAERVARAFGRKR